jgi:3-deoxy-7-phosphoheptulonate synthase
MIVILHPSLASQSFEYQYTLRVLQSLPNVESRIQSTQGKTETITEVYLIGDTENISVDSLEALPGVSRVIRLSREYKILGRRSPADNFSFTYNGVTFSQDSLTLMPGLCAVDNATNVETMMKALQTHHIPCTRMGAYKPRTSPYSFQGLGKECLPYVFELAGRYGIKVIAMEITHERQIEEIDSVLQQAGAPTGVMLQIGTRNAQNFELLRAVGSQTDYPVLFKRGFGITLSESLYAAEYLAHAGNHNIIFCLRGIKSLMGAPHRNMVDFAHVPVVKRLTHLPVGIDPSHSVGILGRSPDGMNDIFHCTAQGIISGANLVLVDFHPNPPQAVVDSRQAIPVSELGWYLDDIAIAREAYEKRQALAEKWKQKYN